MTDVHRAGLLDASVVQDSWQATILFQPQGDGPIRGVVQMDGGSAPMEFWGWLALLQVLERIADQRTGTHRGERWNGA